jgi:Asp-tRNA(Asn)/Glu-tRNA(Gln) amidotransferase B subunit
MIETGDSPAVIVEARGMRQVSDAGAIESAVLKVIEANPDEPRATVAARRSSSVVRGAGHARDARARQSGGRE